LELKPPKRRTPKLDAQEEGSRCPFLDGRKNQKKAGVEEAGHRPRMEAWHAGEAKKHLERRAAGRLKKEPTKKAPGEGGIWATPGDCRQNPNTRHSRIQVTPTERTFGK